MTYLTRLTISASVAAVLSAAPAHAQTMPQPPNTDVIRLRIGPLFMNPVLTLTNAGVDTNVFNEADADGPERDLTITVTPAVDWWLRLGRTWGVGNVKEDLVWYKEFAAQRSANGNYTGAWLVPFNRLTVAVGGNYVNTHERPGFEIDARAHRWETAGNAIVELRALAKTFFSVRGERRNVEFDDSEVFLGTNLASELNRTITSGSFTLRNQVTPLTSLSFSVGREQDRFEFSPLRDADSTHYDASVAFQPFALISGSATVGFRDFQPLSPDLPGYKGSTASANLSYTALGSTRIGVGVNRDIEYSFDVNQPYYLLTGFNLTIAQQIFGPVDVEARLGRQRLEYTDREGAAVVVSDRVDHQRTQGGGVGYRLSRDLRIGFNVDRAHRTSEVDTREYNGLRYGFSVTYGQ